jgi:hypothetical protein
VDATPEEWRPVVGYEGLYEVSNHGRVQSLDRTITFSDGRSRFARGRILKPWITNGYQMVGLGKVKRYVHDLVLEGHVGPKPLGYVARHGQLGSLVNSVENLCYGTYSDNEYDKLRDGTHQQASKTECPSGHQYTPENTRLYTYRGWRYRYCKTCQSAADRAYRARKRKAS